MYHDRIDLQGVCGEMEYAGEGVSETIYGLVSLKPCRRCGERARMVHEYHRTDRDYYDRCLVRCFECGRESCICDLTAKAVEDWNQSNGDQGT